MEPASGQGIVSGSRACDFKRQAVRGRAAEATTIARAIAPTRAPGGNAGARPERSGRPHGGAGEVAGAEICRTGR